MQGTCVVTGGGGFIGCALSAGLSRRFSRVIVLDNLIRQVHAAPVRPAALHTAVEFHRADITEPAVWDDLLAGCDPRLIVHLAAETGTAQSLTAASRHAHVNVVGTTVMLDALARHARKPERIILASSRAVYGEGAWQRSDGNGFYPGLRSREQLARAEWNFIGARPLPSSSDSTVPHPSSIYGATKLAQEHLLAAWTAAFGPDLIIARLQNVYGPGQSLINSYTGIVTQFARLARGKQSIPLYEDGSMLRDFVFIEDVTAALLAIIDAAPVGRHHVDIGSGNATSIRQIADFVAHRYSAPAPHVSAAYRYGDVRHASCDISHTSNQFRWMPQWPLEKGLAELCAWIDVQLNPLRNEDRRGRRRQGAVRTQQANSVAAKFTALSRQRNV